MKIYTGFGDKGKTRLYGGEVVGKDHPRVEVYGTLDELNSWLGLIISEEQELPLKDKLISIQNNIFDISSEIASPDSETRNKLKNIIKESDYNFLEKFIDSVENNLDSLKNFILPGGTKLASYYHIARTICRRSERQLTKLKQTESISEDICIYLNRLSDLLFVLARLANKKSGIIDSLKSG